MNKVLNPRPASQEHAIFAALAKLSKRISYAEYNRLAEEGLLYTLEGKAIQTTTLVDRVVTYDPRSGKYFSHELKDATVIQCNALSKLNFAKAQRSVACGPDAPLLNGAGERFLELAKLMEINPREVGASELVLSTAIKRYKGWCKFRQFGTLQQVFDRLEEARQWQQLDVSVEDARKAIHLWRQCQLMGVSNALPMIQHYLYLQSTIQGVSLDPPTEEEWNHRLQLTEKKSVGVQCRPKMCEMATFMDRSPVVWKDKGHQTNLVDVKPAMVEMGNQTEAAVDDVSEGETDSIDGSCSPMVGITSTTSQPKKKRKHRSKKKKAVAAEPVDGSVTPSAEVKTTEMVQDIVLDKLDNIQQLSQRYWSFLHLTFQFSEQRTEDFHRINEDGSVTVFPVGSLVYQTALMTEISREWKDTRLPALQPDVRVFQQSGFAWVLSPLHLERGNQTMFRMLERRWKLMKTVYSDLNWVFQSATLKDPFQNTAAQRSAIEAALKIMDAFGKDLHDQVLDLLLNQAVMIPLHGEKWGDRFSVGRMMSTVTTFLTNLYYHLLHEFHTPDNSLELQWTWVNKDREHYLRLIGNETEKEKLWKRMHHTILYMLQTMYFYVSTPLYGAHDAFSFPVYGLYTTMMIVEQSILRETEGRLSLHDVCDQCEKAMYVCKEQCKMLYCMFQKK